MLFESFIISLVSSLSDLGFAGRAFTLPGFDEIWTPDSGASVPPRPLYSIVVGKPTIRRIYDLPEKTFTWLYPDRTDQVVVHASGFWRMAQFAASRLDFSPRYFTVENMALSVFRPSHSCPSVRNLSNSLIGMRT